jgi:hypothetical protein
MGSDNVMDLIKLVLPMLIMSISNGTSLTNLLPIIVVPLFIFAIDIVKKIYSYLFKDRAPSKYMSYRVLMDMPMVRGSGCFQDNLSMFLEKYFAESVTDGIINSNQGNCSREKNNGFKTIEAIVKPGDYYTCKINFLDKKTGRNIITEIKKTGFPIDDNIDVNKLLSYPIYLSISSVEEEVNFRKQMQKVNKKYLTVKAIDMKTAKDFIFIVINYQRFIYENVTNFNLIKYLYYQGSDERYMEAINCDVNVKKTYENTFLSEHNMKLVKDVIGSWQTNYKIQLKQGIPNKLGLFLHGVPGCGKSSLIYAIANETKKHVISVNLQDCTIQTFIKSMSRIDNCVVVFEDIDAHEFTHKRDLSAPKQNKSIIKMDSELDSKKKEKSLFSLQNLTLDVLLDVLDGYNYLNNCIVIITSNHPELLDPAILRPGRIDHWIKFDLCDEFQFRNIFKYFTGKDYKSINKNFIFKKNKYSSSHIINTIVKPNSTNPAKILKLLNK